MQVADRMIDSIFLNCNQTKNSNYSRCVRENLRNMSMLDIIDQRKIRWSMVGYELYLVRWHPCKHVVFQSLHDQGIVFLTGKYSVIRAYFS